MWRVPSSGRVYNHLKAHGEELAVLVSRLEEADLVDGLPLLVEKDEAALNLLVEHHGQRLRLIQVLIAKNLVMWNQINYFWIRILKCTLHSDSGSESEPMVTI